VTVSSSLCGRFLLISPISDPFVVGFDQFHAALDSTLARNILCTQVGDHLKGATVNDYMPDYVKRIDYMGVCVTADVDFFDEGAVVTALVSRLYPTGNVHLMSSIQQPVNVRTTVEAVASFEKEFLGAWIGLIAGFPEPSNLYQIDTPLTSEARFGHALAHLQAHREMGVELSIPDRIEGTARDYRFLMEMSVAKPAVLLAELDGVQPKTVQHRFYLMRAQGLMPAYGHGRKTKPRT
jgi:hypothetical protein